jgi:hypothetical protein
MSREYIGVTKLFHQERMFKLGQKLILQNASQAKGFVSDKRIKDLGLWSPGWRHAMDGYRHLIYYMVNGTAFKDDPAREWILTTAYK